MCGIAGLMTLDGTQPDEKALNAFETALAHRGPDGTGRYVNDNIALVQTRLAIIDLETGDQPIVSEDGPVISANGEIYNFVELRAKLPERAMKTGSDCEPPLHIYNKNKIAFVDDLRGMYGISIYDPNDKKLIISRDPFGIKPLYYAETQRGFAFASEAQALIQSGLVSPEVRPSARDELLQLQFSCGRETIFRGIKRVLPGETLVIVRGVIVEHHTRKAVNFKKSGSIDMEAALKQLDEILRDSVEKHQRSDVPFGMFLSGGIDSSILIKLMADINDRPVKAFTCGFSGTNAADEREQAQKIAEIVGADHHCVDFEEQDFLSLLPRIAKAHDDLIADYAVLPTFKLAMRAAEDVKVVLSGEGGDELFGGYGRYRTYCRAWPLRKNIRANGNFDGLGLFREPLSANWRKGISEAETKYDHKGISRLKIAQGIDCTDWLPHNLLIKLDRCLMANALEGRTPFLDPIVGDFALNLPDELKIEQRLGKVILREWLNRNLPEANPFAKKQGFTVPVGHWIEKHGEKLGQLVAKQQGILEIAKQDAVENLFKTKGKQESFAAWTLLFYALWHQVHILGLKGEGDVFDALAEQ